MPKKAVSKKPRAKGTKTTTNKAVANSNAKVVVNIDTKKKGASKPRAKKAAGSGQTPQGREIQLVSHIPQPGVFQIKEFSHDNNHQLDAIHRKLAAIQNGHDASHSGRIKLLEDQVEQGKKVVGKLLTNSSHKEKAQPATVILKEATPTPTPTPTPVKAKKTEEEIKPPRGPPPPSIRKKVGRPKKGTEILPPPPYKPVHSYFTRENVPKTDEIIPMPTTAAYAFKVTDMQDSLNFPGDFTGNSGLDMPPPDTSNQLYS